MSGIFDLSVDGLIAWAVTAYGAVTVLLALQANAPGLAAGAFLILAAAWWVKLVAAETLAGRLALAVLVMLQVVLQVQVVQGLHVAHMGFFVVLALLLVYRDPRPIILAAAVVAAFFVLADRLQAAGWPVYGLDEPNFGLVGLHLFYLLAQTAFECRVATSFRRQIRSMQDMRKTLVETLEQAIDSVVVIDEHNRITLFNAAAERLWGYSREEVLGRNVKLLVPPSVRSEHDAYIDANRETGINRIVGTSREVPIYCRDGTQRWGMMSISKVRLDGRILYTAFIRDVTRLREERSQMRLLSAAANESDIAVLVLGMDRRIVFANAGSVRMFGYEVDALLGRLPSDLLSGPHTDLKVLSQVQSNVDQGQPSMVDILTYTRDRRPLWASLVLNPVHGGDGRVSHYIAVFSDITLTKMHEVLQYKMLDAMARETPTRELMLLLCREVERIAPDVVVCVNVLDETQCLKPLAAPSLPADLLRAMSGLPIGPAAGANGAAAWQRAPVLVVDDDEDALWLACRHALAPHDLRACWARPIVEGDGRLLGTLAFYFRGHCEPSGLHRRLMDVSLHLCVLILEREQARAHILQLASYDVLTGVSNRSMLMSRVGQLLREARRRSESLALLFVDLDHFKQINDSHGPGIGDQVLRLMAKRLAAFTRDIDAVGRLSGDEFVLALADSNATAAAAAVGKLKASLEVPLTLDGIELRVTASIGVAMYPDDGVQAEELLRRADIAMYQAKAKEGGGYCFFSPDMQSVMRERMRLEADLRRAVAHDELQLYYQPKVYADDGALYGVEALLRWEHPEYGMVPPVRFVSLAEQTGLIHELGLWVLRQACTHMADWRRRGVPVPNVAVNLSASNFQRPALPSWIAEQLDIHGLMPGDLTVEMTESVMLKDDPAVLSTVMAVHELGVTLSLDDFGTGYSSLSLLHRLPISELKLDRSFVRDVGHSDMAQALARSVLGIGRSLGLTVVAEGVETDAQFRFIQEEGCRVIQGYRYAPPLSPEALERWLAHQAALAEARLA